MPDLKFELKDDRQIVLDSLFESKTYAGLLEGSPNASVNGDILRALATTATRMWPKEPNTLLGDEHYRARIFDPFPRIICMGQFISYKPASDPTKAGSSLVIIWLQEEMFPLLQGQNSNWLRAVAWNQLARNFDW
jgi:hypothetical protein